MLSPAQGVGQSINKVGNWSNSLALTETSVTPDGNYLIRLANNSGEEFTVSNVKIGDTNANYSQDLFQGNAQNFVIDSSDVCSSGDGVTKQVTITFVSKNGISKTEVYPVDTYFNCENYTVSLLANQCTSYTTRTLDGSTVSGLAGYYAAFNLSTIDTNLISGDIRSGATIFGVSGTSTVVNTSDANAQDANVLAGYDFYGASGVLTNGTIQTRTPSASSVLFSSGYYASDFNLSVIDSGLNADNILDTATIFGITGTASAGGGGVEADFHFSETKDYFVRTAPGSQGIVTDPKNGLIWQDGIKGGTDTQANAITYCTNLNWGGFSSGWRLPSVYELYTLVDVNSYVVGVKENYFPSVFQTVGTTSEYNMWSSTTGPSLTIFAYVLSSALGGIYYGFKTDGDGGVRCVRSE